MIDSAINQHGDSFPIRLKNRFNKSAKEMLVTWCELGLSYKEVAYFTDFHVATVRKWCRRYNVRLRSRCIEKQVDFARTETFKKPEINTHNVLSRKWLSKTLYTENDK